MIIDARTISSQEQLAFDLCIVGAGPSGLTLAKELAHLDLSICILESGDYTFSEKTQSLCEGEIASRNRYPEDELTAGRCRQLGGSANFWEIQVDDNDVAQNVFNVRHVIPDELDFQQRDDIPYSGWPFSRSDLMPYYQRAQKICQAGPLSYAPEDWETDRTPQLKFSSSRICSRIFQFGPRRAFTHDYIEELEAHRSIKIYTNAHVTELMTTAGDQVDKVKVETSTEHSFFVSAERFILAAGGMENARLLLLSNRVLPQGLGNQNDLVGRFFMDHPAFLFGILKPNDKTIFNRTGLYDLHRVDGTSVMARLVFSEETLRKEKLLNVGLALLPKPPGLETQAVASFRRFMQSLRRRKLSRKAI